MRAAETSASLLAEAGSVSVRATAPVVVARQAEQAEGDAVEQEVGRASEVAVWALAELEPTRRDFSSP